MAEADHIPSSAQEARLWGAKTYLTGKLCRYGHLAYRYTACQSCAECKKLSTKARIAKAVEDADLAATMREWCRRSKSKARATLAGRRAHREANKRYIERNRQSVAAYYRRRRLESPEFAMACWMRGALHKVLSRSNRRKDAKAAELLGYSREKLRAHIEAQFVKGMGWHNRSEWHIDHVIPVAEMLRRGESDPAIVNALCNLRPMWAKDNMAKKDKVLTLL